MLILQKLLAPMQFGKNACKYYCVSYFFFLFKGRIGVYIYGAEKFYPCHILEYDNSIKQNVCIISSPLNPCTRNGLV